MKKKTNPEEDSRMEKLERIIRKKSDENRLLKRILEKLHQGELPDDEDDPKKP
jgi:hypothetical protein